MANLDGWPYWKVISITGQAGSGTDYQAKLTMGDSAGGDFHLEGHCMNFPQDIRITDDDGTTLLDHFVEDLTADPIVVHVEVKDDLGSNRDIRVYYGKSGETTASNGANTFIQYHGVASSEFHDSNIITPPVIYEAKVRQTSDSETVLWGIGEVVNLVTSAGSDDKTSIMSYGPLSRVYLKTVDNGAHTDIYESPHLTQNQWYNIQIDIVSASEAHGYVDGNEIASGATTNIPNEAMGLAFYESSGSGEQEWSFARKFNSPEPAFSSAGAEQSPTGVSPTSVFYGPLVGPLGGPI